MQATRRDVEPAAYQCSEFRGTTRNDEDHIWCVESLQGCGLLPADMVVWMPKYVSWIACRRPRKAWAVQLGW